MEYDLRWQRSSADRESQRGYALAETNASTVEFTQKKAGKVVITGTRTISPDGKVMTITSKGTNTLGQTIDDVEVFEKR